MTQIATPDQMDKAFDPTSVEPRWRSFWEEKDFFRAAPETDKPRFVMVIPPPNITGRLHVGHGLNNTLQDILARWKRMDGYDVLWLPGSDHASIATHVMIERELEKEGVTRQQLGREEFIKRAWTTFATGFTSTTMSRAWPACWKAAGWAKLTSSAVAKNAPVFRLPKPWPPFSTTPCRNRRTGPTPI